MKKKILILLLVIILVGIIGYFLIHKKEDFNMLEEAITRNFEAEIYLYTKEEGGRATPIYENYRPQIRFTTDSDKDVTSILTFFKGETIAPGSSEIVHIELSSAMPLKLKDEFLILEGARIVGKGTIQSLDILRN